MKPTPPRIPPARAAIEIGKEAGAAMTNANKVPADSEARTTTALSAAIGWISAMAPHLLHHAGLLAGTAFLAGTTGAWLFGAIALVAMTPILIRLYRRTGSRLAPVAMVAVMVVMFLVSRLLLA